SGLVLRASRAVPGLLPAPAGAPADVELWLNDEPPWDDPPGEITALVHTSPYRMEGRPTLEVVEMDHGRWFRMTFFDDIEFDVDGAGRRVRGRWADYQTLADASTYLLGPVLGFVLRRRGVTGLHASAVAVDGRAVAMVGPAGAGKSTTAAAFARLGFPVLSDDFVVLEEEGERILARPSYPIIRLWTESARLLYGGSDELPVLAPGWQKRYVDLEAHGYDFVTEPMELAAIYLFHGRRDDPDAPRAEPLPMSEAVVTLAAQTNATFLMTREMRAAEFAFLGRLVRCVPVRRLHPHASPERLDELTGVIVEDCRALRRAGR
ncbi:MAG TPA: hypothetical protein VM778_01915, partial [Gemmatimonadota bacterium]|nr:hypothetical protein [Gemmatimonadota bacterium]